MFGRTHSRSRSSGRRRLQRTGVVAVSVLALAGIYALPANAVHDTGAFELDGNATHQTSDDWDNVCHQVSAAACPSPANTNTATAVSWTAEPNLNSSIFTGGGSKDPQDVSNWAWKDGAGGLPDKDNLLHGFAARYSLAPSATCPAGTATTCEVLFFGSDRYDNSGDAQQGFWFFQNPIGLGTNAVGGGSGFTGVHRAGDLLVISDFSNGGGTSTITVYKWDPTCLKASGACGDVNLRTLETSTNARCGAAAGTGDPFCGIVNPGTITMPWSFTDKSGTPNNGALNGEFYEGGINLSLLGVGDECFSSVASETRSSTSTTATLKDFVLGGFGTCGSTLTTTPKAGDGTAIPADGLSIGTGSVTAKDSAALSVTGVQNWTGNLQFYLCGPIASGTCDTGGVPIGSSIAVSQATSQPIVSDAATLTSAGRYCWRGDFTSTKTGVPDASDHSSGECFTVNPVTPTLTTHAGAGPVDLGQSITDTADLAGTATQPGTNGGINGTYTSINATNALPANGSITFTAYGPDDCTTVASTSSAFTVSGDNTYGPASFIPTAPGTYHWTAAYTGSSPNTNSQTDNTACNQTREDVVVNQVQTTISTRQFVFPQDKTTVSASGGGNLAGSVSFKLYDTSANCTANGATGLLYSEGPLSVSGATTASKTTNNTSFRITSDRTVYWRVTYTSTNLAQLGSSSVCTETTAVAYTGNDTGIAIP
jgi:hypothetical protein